MKTPICVFALCLILVADSPAATKKSASTKHESYPGIIQIPPVPAVREPESGKLITSDLGGLDLRFFRDAMEAGALQAYLGELAKTRGDAEQVKKVGEIFASTQAEENKQIARLAALKGLSAPASDPATVRKIVGDLESLNGPKFDKTVLEQLVAVNRLAVSAYESAAKSRDGDIKTFVEQMLPVAKAKLQLAGKMSGASAGSATPAFRTNTPQPTR